MSLEDRRQSDAPIGVTALAIALRTAKDLVGKGVFNANADFSGLNNARVTDQPNLILRKRVASLLHIAAIEEVDGEKYINELVDTQYEGSMDTLKLGSKPLYDAEQPREGDIPAPTLEEVKAILASRVTPEQLEVIKKMEKPTLQLIPPNRSMADYIAWLNGYKPIEGQVNAHVSAWHEKAFVRADERDRVTGDESIVGWQIAVTEGVREPKLLEGEDIKETLRERDTWFKNELGKIGVSGVDFRRMICVIMGSLKIKQPVNNYGETGGSFTIINEEPEYDDSISGSNWSDELGQLLFGEVSAIVQNAGARIRQSVVINVPFPWNGIERRKRNEPTGVVALRQAGRGAKAGLTGADLYTDTGTPRLNHVREADLQDSKLRKFAIEYLKQANRRKLLRNAGQSQQGDVPDSL